MRLKSLATVVCSLFLLACSVPCANSQQPNISQKDDKSRFAKLDGIRVHYKSFGKGNKALLFVHGWTCDQSSWQFQTPAFKERVRIILVDLPGHGQSDKPRVAYVQNLFARAINAVLKDAKVKRAVLVGHSMGSPTIREFYRLYPKKTLALTLVDGSLCSTAPKESIEKFVTSLRGPDYLTILGAAAEGMLGRQIPALQRDKMKSTILGTPQYVAVSAMEGMTDEELWREDKIGVPVLAVFARSPIWSPDNEMFYRKLAPDLEYHMWEGAGHFLMAEKPKEFNDTLMVFLARIKFLKK